MPFASAGISGQGGGREANIEARKEEQRAAEAQLQKQINDSKQGKAAKGHRPLTKAEIDAINRAIEQRAYWIRRVCFPSQVDNGLSEQRALELCRAYADAVSPPDTRNGTSPGAPPAPPDPELLAQQAVLRLTVPAATPHVGPPPEINQWKMAVVGYPLWLWSSPNQPVTEELTEQGITITMTARKTSTTFDMGDGTTLTCHRTVAWTRAVKANAESPVCGHRYTAPSRKGQPYTVTATDHWEVSWTALGETGVIRLDPQASTTLPVGELHSVVR
ncbi:hypothetical protein ACQBAU_12350 [Propionibacteriaceae bacterium Y2011]|uniref:hypothetical protein n=1 Tax=Microlunatus sp. Y2014 TaxID=3418488 RepID=UPI003B477BB7